MEAAKSRVQVQSQCRQVPAARRRTGGPPPPCARSRPPAAWRRPAACADRPTVTVPLPSIQRQSFLFHFFFTFVIYSRVNLGLHLLPNYFVLESGYLGLTILLVGLEGNFHNMIIILKNACKFLQVTYTTFIQIIADLMAITEFRNNRFLKYY